MKITDIIKINRPSLSFEVFPPKTSDKYESVSATVNEIAKLSPSYMSVTYGAGGGTNAYTAKIASEVSSLGVTCLAHLSCISSTKEQVDSQLTQLKNLNIKNILALRGDIPANLDKTTLDFSYAYQLVDIIKKAGDFCIGGACYPEKHPESENVEKDIEYIKIKVDHGCEFLTTQMFFDNYVFYKFIENLRKHRIHVPIVAGIMPITSLSQIDKMITLSGTELPNKFLNMIDKYKDDPISLKNAGIEYASTQAREIYSNGFNAVHIYTMNKYDVAHTIQNDLKDIIEC